MPLKRFPHRKVSKKVVKRTTKARLPWSLPTIQSSNYAAIVETLPVADDAPNTAYAFSWNLGQFNRAVTLSLAFQEYRFVKCEYRIKPTANLFAPAATLATAIPYLHAIVNTGCLFPVDLTLANLQAMGAKPLEFNAERKIAWRPLVNVNNSPTGNVNNAANIIKRSPWLRTTYDASSTTPSPDNTPHYGLLYFIEQSGTTTETTVSTVEASFTIEFRKPYVDTAAGGGLALTVQKEMKRNTAVVLP